MFLHCAALAVLAVAKGPCSDYFGNGTDAIRAHVAVTVIDPDVDITECAPMNLTAPCTIVHYSGDNSTCASPAPPGGAPPVCHRYLRVFYSKTLCPQLAGAYGPHVHWSPHFDTEGRFDPTTGVLKECSNAVLQSDVSCWAPPAEEPQQCECPDR